MSQAAERTEDATPKRREDERKKGNIARSQDMTSSLVLTSGVGLLIGLMPIMLEKMKNLARYTFTHIKPDQIETDNILAILAPYAKISGEILIPFLVALALVTAAIIRMQVGPLFAIEKIKPKLDKFSGAQIMQGLRKIFNPFEVKHLVEMTKSLLKMGIVGYVGYNVLNSRKDELFGLVGADLNTAFAVLGSILVHMVISMCLAMLIIGFIDKKYQTYEYEKSIKMTKQEVKDEFKNTEGDPMIKAKIRSAQMQIMRQKMMSAVPTADVVVANPTHYSVAIKYDKSRAPAPMVVAKGVDFMAFKIREIARANDVPIVVNKPLARALYKLVKVDSVIPADLYVAVAEILAYVYKKNTSQHIDVH